MLTVQQLKKKLRYNPETGLFHWNIYCGGRAKQHAEAGWLGGRGYVYINIDRKSHLASRLAWLYMTGVWPSEVDHRDQDKRNNKWGNLRLATRSQNQANRGPNKRNSSGFKGVSWWSGAWNAEIRVDRKRIWLGRHQTPEAARDAYKSAAHKYFGEFSST